MKTPRHNRSGATACICCNGEIQDLERARKLASGADLLIAADGGARYLAQMGLKPHVVIGDMDSIEENFLSEEEGTRAITFSRDKDRSDAELAVHWAIRQGAGRILLLGAWGGRPDHTIGNTALLTRFPGILEIHDDGYLVLALAAGQRLEVRTFPGAVVSIFSFDGNARIKTAGLKYELDDENLKYATHGLSNVAARDTFSITVNQGMVILCAQGEPTCLQM